MRSMNDRVASMLVAFSRWRALNSNMSVVNRRPTSITAVSFFGPHAATLNAIRIASLFDAPTACAIGSFGSATTL
jgi:hypothetical protein